MTKIEALTAARVNFAEDTDVYTTLTKMIDTIQHAYEARKNRISDEERAAASVRRKAETAVRRATLMRQVLPVLRTNLIEDVTAKELYATCAADLPEDWTANKVQYALLHELADEVIKTEAKGKPNVYRLK